MDDNDRNSLQQIIDEALEEMAGESPGAFDPQKINLAEFSRRTGLTRSKARTIQKHGFKALPHGRCGRKAETGVLTGYTDALDALLRSGVTNSSVCLERIRAQGYSGGLTRVKDYISEHAALVPAKRRLAAAPQGGRGQRFATGPGEAYQMDWGFVNVEDRGGARCRIACFAMICHHCGSPYIEFFPNARQENLFIGMARAFAALGVPDFVLTDNMKSVVIGRDMDGRPVWQRDYAAFMACVGFGTKLCKPRHPFTKGKVERLVRFVKDNFLAGRPFTDITRLNEEALLWCEAQAGRYHRALDGVPAETHASSCAPRTRPIERTDELAAYLCPLRRISFDGFVTYEGRRFGVPYWYGGRECRVSREGRCVHVYSDDLSQELSAHEVTWSRRDSVCEHQWADIEPVELPSQPPTTTLLQAPPAPEPGGFARFDFSRGLR